MGHFLKERGAFKLIEELLWVVNDEFLFIVPALWVIGFALKKTPFFPDWAIIWALLLVSVVSAFSFFGVTVQAFAQGVSVAGVAVFSHQLFKQSTIEAKKKRKM
ncbi:phage holin family protein [Aquibacillus albus]|uniref:Holin n=1 Tax=Aquibacillus albus TaxID=1168171 RepID=A0ABS2MX97_9BACI|nr:phage holin family protein [Aquibacillus albus]MBM7570492.1 hypothetical protein [Aquibacillus albus]